MAQFSYVENDGFKNLTVFLNGKLESITGEHPRFKEIFARVVDEDDDLADLDRILDPAIGVAERFEKVSTQVSVKNGHVLFEGREVHNTLTDQILRFYDEGNEDFKPLVKFLENLSQNPNEHSKEHLYRWLSVHEIPITKDGLFVAYKGVKQDLTSWHKGNGVVDGKQYHMAHLPNHPGSEVEMPRDEVTFDPDNGCSFGLHAGTWAYANGFANRTLEVHINPRDVVSVPSDHGDQKLRTCRYWVIQELDRPYETAYVWDGNDEDEIEDDEDDLDYEEDYYDDEDEDDLNDEYASPEELARRRLKYLADGLNKTVSDGAQYTVNNRFF